MRKSGWWEDLKTEDVPRYVKDGRGVYKVMDTQTHLEHTVHIECPLQHNPLGVRLCSLRLVDPATEEEYNNQTNAVQKENNN